MTIITNMDTESRPIKWVFDEFKKGNLYIDESFQRNYIWIRKDRVSLLETIILGYPIPEIYLWETGTDSDTGETKYSIIDGQQRIRTIGSFIDNSLKLTDSGLEFSDVAYKGKTFEELKPEVKRSIWAYKISIRFVKKVVKREDIVKMFLRLNKTANALNPQELRNAEFHGEFLEASVAVASSPTLQKWRLFSDVDLRRMQDIQFASTLLIFIRSGFEDETTQSAINRMYDLYNDSYPSKEKDLASIRRTMVFLDKIIERQSELATPLRKKTHLYTVFTLLFSVKQKTSANAERLAHVLHLWFSWLEKPSAAPRELRSSVTEYRRLSQEGVQKKANRLARYEVLAKYVRG